MLYLTGSVTSYLTGSIVSYLTGSVALYLTGSVAPLNMAPQTDVLSKIVAVTDRLKYGGCYASGQKFIQNSRRKTLCLARCDCSAVPSDGLTRKFIGF